MDLRMAEFDSVRGKIAKMIYSGVCGTDKHAIRGQLDMKFPVILGHENVAEIDGARFTWPTIIPCGRCGNCKIGMENVCDRNMLFGITTRDPMTGGWSEYAYIPEDAVLFRVPDSLDDDVAVLIETMASTKALNQVDVGGKYLLIIGSGPIGLLSAIHAKSKGAATVAMTGHNEQAVLARKNIDVFYDKGTPVSEMEGNFDIVMDAGGSRRSLEYSVDAVAPRGTVIESGCMTKDMMFDVSRLVKKELKMVTSLGYVPKDFGWATDLVVENQDALRKVITHKFKLDEHKKALETMFGVPHGKIMFSPGH